MSVTSTLIGDVATPGPGVRQAVDEMAIDDVTDALGISADGVVALARAGHFGSTGAGGLLRSDVDDLAARIWRAALPTTSRVQSVRLVDAVDATDVGSARWPAVIAALLDGRVNAFRRRGSLAGGVVTSLMVSSERVVAELAPPPGGAGEAPFIWTPTSHR